jgi:hypothetical protein
MTTVASKTIIATLLSGGVLTLAGSARAYDQVYYPAAAVLRAGDCSKWADTEDTMRCFYCLRKVWNGRDWEWANTCPDRRIGW